MGFAAKDCLQALELCSGNLDNAALWLTHHATPVSQFANFLDFTRGTDLNDENEVSGLMANKSVLEFQQLEVCTF